MRKWRRRRRSCVCCVLRKPRFPFISPSFPFPRGSVVLASVKSKAGLSRLAAAVCVPGSRFTQAAEGTGSRFSSERLWLKLVGHLARGRSGCYLRARAGGSGLCQLLEEKMNPIPAPIDLNPVERRLYPQHSCSHSLITVNHLVCLLATLGTPRLCSVLCSPGLHPLPKPCSQRNWAPVLTSAEWAGRLDCSPAS